MIPPGDVDRLRADFANNPNELGVGLYNPTTGVIRLGGFDSVTFKCGHYGLAAACGIVDDAEWRGFTVNANGRFAGTSSYNRIDGSVKLLPAYERAIC